MKETNGQEDHGISRLERNSTCLIHLFAFQRGNTSKARQRACLWRPACESWTSDHLLCQPSKEGNPTSHPGTTDRFKGDMGVLLEPKQEQRTGNDSGQACQGLPLCQALLHAQAHSVGPHSKRGSSLSPFTHKVSRDNLKVTVGVLFWGVLGLKRGGSCMLGKCFTTKSHPEPR